MFGTSNPTINTLKYAETPLRKAAEYRGISIKTLILLAIIAIASVVSIVLQNGNSEAGWGENGIYWGIDYWILIVFAVFTAFLCALLSTLIPRVAMFLSPVYAFCNGFVIGLVSVLFEGMFAGVVFAALISTVISFAAVVIMHRLQMFRVAKKYKKVLFTVFITLSVSQFVFVMVSSYFGAVFFDFTLNYWLQLGMSAFLTLLATFCILADLQIIDDYVNYGMDKKYEWVASLGLVISLFWMYFRFINLIVIFISKRKKKK